MGNWVRFADTKATILTAGLGVILTMLVSSAKTVTRAVAERTLLRDSRRHIHNRCGDRRRDHAVLVGQGDQPQRNITYSTRNRFGWPALPDTDAATLMADAEKHHFRA